MCVKVTSKIHFKQNFNLMCAVDKVYVSVSLTQEEHMDCRRMK